ncbi:MAG TPA: cysteine hydrolase family protein [Noviherbaspirillum sp.]|uniref:cysteine hydrolase family protein n=1 Tax=Noviherbaspirillum sp. TaxID=1926288 RepID=UPI002B483FE1|nr:cysteine hydrolase family protein [Noviherbaspirillum sp.]HJV87337.1 cysteine hydrolase family protein [Noviherbaspirillum sp.]
MPHPTMRAISGAPATQTLVAKNTALIVIDFQLEYFEGGRLFIPDGAAAMSKAKRLVSFADAHDMPVFHVQHLGPANGPLFAKGGEKAAFHPGMTPGSQHVLVQKTTASSFASTDLHQQLQVRGIKTLIICGLMTHMCVSTTTRDARPLGYQVLVAGDACATRDIDAWDSGVVGHAELHRAALTALSDSFAEVLRTDAITALAVN